MEEHTKVYYDSLITHDQKNQLYKGVLEFLPVQLPVETQAALAMTMVQMATDECLELANKREAEWYKK